MEFPMTKITLNLTQNCNLKCSYCFSGSKTSKAMPLSMAKKAVDFVVKNAMTANLSDLPENKRAIDISFWGGEPLLEWKLLKEIVLYTKAVKPLELDATFGATVNGTLLTSEKLDFLEEHKIYFMLSLDGTEDTHDRHRKFLDDSGSHKSIVKNMKEVLSRWPFYRVRMSLYPERIAYFYDDFKYLVDLGFSNIYYSPIYEYVWEDEHFNIWKKECFRAVDLIADYQKKGKEIKVEHFITYAKGTDGVIWPCGAGRNYIGVDMDGSLWPCHRFAKFNDSRPWQEKEWCMGHIDYGITRPDIRDKFINYKVRGCEGKNCFSTSPCHGGCYAVNADLEGNIETPHPQICKYVEMQLAVSEYYKEKVKIDGCGRRESCICYNMCYLEDTENEVKQMDGQGVQCHCYNTNYSGKPLKAVTPQDVMDKLISIENKIFSLEKTIQNRLCEVNGVSKKQGID